MINEKMNMKQLTREQVKQIKALQNEYKHETKENKSKLELNNINDKILSMLFFELMPEKLSTDLAKELYTKINGQETWCVLVNKFMALSA